MAGQEFTCPYSKDPRNPACIPEKRCAQVAEFQRKADTEGAKTKDLALKSDKNKGGPWYKTSRFNSLRVHYRNVSCGQIEFKKRKVDEIQRKKQSSGKLIFGK